MTFYLPENVFVSVLWNNHCKVFSTSYVYSYVNVVYCLSMAVRRMQVDRSLQVQKGGLDSLQ